MFLVLVPFFYNEALGYRLYYNLLHFDLYQARMQFAGTSRFEELRSTDARQQAKWQARGRCNTCWPVC